MEGESCKIYQENSSHVPKEGWGLFERPLPSRLDPRARDFLVDLFNEGQKDRNSRSSPQTAELRLRDKFPGEEKCWLSVKQVTQRN